MTNDLRATTAADDEKEPTRLPASGGSFFRQEASSVVGMSAAAASLRLDAQELVPAVPSRGIGNPLGVDGSRSPHVMLQRICGSGPGESESPCDIFSNNSKTPLQSLFRTITPSDLHFERSHSGTPKRGSGRTPASRAWTIGKGDGLHHAGPAAHAVAPAVLFAVAAIVIEWLGSVMVLTGLYRYAGALLLAAFTLASTFIANRFWEVNTADHFMLKNAFFEHLGLVGGFVFVAWFDLRQRHGLD